MILLQDVPGVGKKWEAKEVKGGYARNYLLVRNLAAIATQSALKDVKLKQEQEAQKSAIQKDLLEKTIDSLQDKVFIIERKANEKGHLFDGVDAREIAEILKEKFPPKARFAGAIARRADQPLAEKIEIPFEYIKLEKPIKEIGKHEIMVQKGDRQVSFQIEIKPEEKD